MKTGVGKTVADFTETANGKMIEAEAAHIIGKDVLGTDDPRNGLALSRTVHWAFDDGLFTISAEYEFGRTITESNEYGVGRGELALSWCPNQSLNSLRHGHA